jgi:hypothetical protein
MSYSRSPLRLSIIRSMLRLSHGDSMPVAEATGME